HVHPNLQEYPNASLFVEEFEEYKKQAFDYAKENGCLAADFLPALTEEDQKSLPLISIYLVGIGFFIEGLLQMIPYIMFISSSRMMKSVSGMMIMVLALINGGVAVMRH
ncbi:MAG: hypothetical protein Q610_ECBC00196G0001, partial [Escherichia coli DORA_B_14]